MAYVTSDLIFVLLFSVYVATRAFDGNAFYCRDPDTGKLHPINSTWQSTSFCGNYSCKLKKRNGTETEYKLIRQYNISIDNLTNNESERNAESQVITTPVSMTIRNESDVQPILHVNFNAENNTDNDRYLTKAEIKSITEILHTIKRSDLNAIIEIYNLAQDIYKEIDNQTLDNDIDSVNTPNNDIKILPNTKPTSYWYEPLNVNGQKAARSIDMERQGSNLVQSAVAFKSEPKQSYYSGILPSNFGNVPYYYSMSDFQRLSSYIHQTPTKPCNLMNEHNLINKVLKRNEQKLIQPSILLPYPFSYVNTFNTSYLNNNYYDANPWLYYDLYKHRSYRPYVYVNPNPTYAVPNPQQNIIQEAEFRSVSKEENSILDSLISKAKDVKLPDWQTAPLPNHVLDEVRANIEKSTLLKPFPFRKKVNLERVGKLLKLDEFSRSKRDTDSKLEGETSKEDEGLFESILETVTCPPDNQPGYFRKGNLSRPYPECCPQRIEKPIVSV